MRPYGYEETYLLHEDAKDAGDHIAAAWCDIAVADDETVGEYGDPHVHPETGGATTRAEARRIVAKILDDAEAQRDDDDDDDRPTRRPCRMIGCDDPVCRDYSRLRPI